MNAAASSSTQGASRKTPWPAAGMRLNVVRSGGQRPRELLGACERERRIVLPREEEHGAGDPADVLTQVQLAGLDTRPDDGRLGVDAHARDDVGIETAAGVERQADAHVVREGRLGRVTEIAGGDLARFGAASLSNSETDRWWT